jgi:CheY-like chemotaxis protein
MKILVIDDKELHRNSAEKTLTSHEVTIVSSFDEAMDLMAKKIDIQNVQQLLAEGGFAEKPEPTDKERWSAYWKAVNDAEKKSIIPFPFEVVLTDMMMPMSRSTLAPGIFNPREQVPYGFVIALKAAGCGAKFVAMVTDVNHHKGAMSAAIDHLGSAYYHEGRIKTFTVNDAKVAFIHAPFCKDRESKDWGQVLADLTK